MNPRVPREIAALVDRVSAADRQWFIDHPFELVRDRVYVPGEFWPLDRDGRIEGRPVVASRVWFRGPNERARAPIFAATESALARLRGVLS